MTLLTWNTVDSLVGLVMASVEGLWRAAQALAPQAIAGCLSRVRGHTRVGSGPSDSQNQSPELPDRLARQPSSPDPDGRLTALAIAGAVSIESVDKPGGSQATYCRIRLHPLPARTSEYGEAVMQLLEQI
jgi:hypothetical protein